MNQKFQNLQDLISYVEKEAMKRVEKIKKGKGKSYEKIGPRKI